MVSVVVLRGTGTDTRVLLLRRTRPPLRGAWIYVAGHIRAGEPAWQCARRELREEAGLLPQALYSADTCETYYDRVDECIAVVPAFVAFVHDQAKVTLDQESDSHRWLPVAEAIPMLPFGGQRELFAHVQREFVERPPASALRMPEGH